MIPKELVLDTIQRLPDDAEIEDAIDALLLRMTLESRMADLDNGLYVEHEEAVRQLLRS